MQKRVIYTIFAAAVLYFAAPCIGQTAGGKAKPERFRDADGNLVSNNEFVDIRMANFNYPDATIVRISDDGTKEFQLQKIPQEGMAAPAFSVRTLDGTTVSLDSLKGKVVVLNFWFIGCPVCRGHKPKLNELKSKFSGTEDVVFLAMSPDAGSSVKAYIKKEPFDYLQAPDAAVPIKQFRFSGYPKNIVLNRKGEIVYWRSTIAAWDKFEAVVRAEILKK